MVAEPRQHYCAEDCESGMSHANSGAFKRDFRARCKQLSAARNAKYSDGFGIIPVSALDDPEFITEPKVGDRWGQWRYENDGRHWERRLIFAGRYGIAARYKTAIAAFRTILHVSQKAWATPEVIGHMVQALMDINSDLEGLCYSQSKKGKR